jgi:hypothetical protein
MLLIFLLLIAGNIAGIAGSSNIDLNNSNNNGPREPERSNLISKADPLENGLLDAEEYQVFSALIEEVFLGGKNHSIPVFIRDYTDFPESIVSNLSGSREGQNQETLQDFKAKNSHEFKLERSFNLKENYILVNEKNNPGVKDIVGFSRVGFDANRTQALVHVDEIKRWYVSMGYLTHLQKKGNVWKVKEMEMTYIGE